MMLPMGAAKLLPNQTRFLQTTYEMMGDLTHRAALNREYMLSLTTQNLLRNHYFEAGIWSQNGHCECAHGGWESPTSQLRGHFLGHWLSAAAQIWAGMGDAELKSKADAMVSELARCQARNGGGWVFGIPEKYLRWIAEGEIVWAPQYTAHKTLMGLWDMYRYADNRQALDVLAAAADWFCHWSEAQTQEQFERTLDFETGGMLEVWASLYGATGDARHRALMDRYDRKRVFDPLRRGEDALTNLHANTTIPEVLGCARAYEVTGDERWRQVVDGYWRQAVTERGFYATGGQTNGEAWTPRMKQAARLGKSNQEHCSVYNMMRLADILYRWTGEPQYADYWERNLYNGLLAQEHPQTGMVAYYLPLEAGGQKHWGHPTQDFWCCHGSLVQAPAMIAPSVFHQSGGGFVVSQYIPATMEWDGVHLRLEQDAQYEMDDRPMCIRMKLIVAAERGEQFTIRCRMPWWCDGAMGLCLNGKPIEAQPSNGFVAVERAWGRMDVLEIELPKRLRAVSMPDEPDMVAFMDGPVVLAGLTDGELSLRADGPPEAMLRPHNEFSCECWRGGWKTRGQAKNTVFIPLHCVTDERYQVYFPVLRT